MSGIRDHKIYIIILFFLMCFAQILWISLFVAIDIYFSFAIYFNNKKILLNKRLKNDQRCDCKCVRMLL